MTHTPHELAADFPEYAEKIHELKLHDAHFVKLADEYHDLNRAIHRAETGVEAVADFAETDMRKRRMQLKDEIAAILAKS
jgi:uncharacterized protein YdcH (DUF465 family)